jgi:PIN domain nuclease of toxin-antitoxin system
VKLLLDTQAFLWFVLNDARLSPAARTLLIDPANELLLSPASYWEIAIKVSIGKYQVPGSFKDFMDRQIVHNQLSILPVAVSHAAGIVALPFHHRDPFDRLLIAQALAENVPLVSADTVVDAYGVTRLW